MNIQYPYYIRKYSSNTGNSDKDILPKEGEYQFCYTDLSPPHRSIIKALYKNVAGIYCWYNTKTGRCYVGRSINLKGRFTNYFGNGYISKNASKMEICAALLNDGYEVFHLYIL